MKRIHCSSGAIACWGATRRCSTTSRCTWCAARACGCMTPTASATWTPTTTCRTSGHCHPRVVAALEPAGRHPEHPHALSRRERGGLRRAAHLAVRPAALDGHVLLHRQRSERAGAAHCARLQRRLRDHIDGMGLPRQHGGGDAGELAVHARRTSAVPYVRTVPVMDPYRDRAGRSDEELATAYANDVKRAIDAFAAAGDPLRRPAVLHGVLQ